LFQMKCSSVYFTVVLMTLQLSLARYDAKCFAHYMQLLFVLAPYCIYSLIEHYF
jgi:hypothetical protein